MTSLLVVALEASADLHGAAVLRSLRELRPDVRAFGAGGPLMRAEGFEALVNAEELSVMGIAEVIPRLPQLLDAMDLLGDAARDRPAKAALLIDSPDFNLRLARRLRRSKVPVAYFIGPSVWAWRTSRVKQIARDITRMLVILPFERAFYASHGVDARYVGNPLADDLLALTKGAPQPLPSRIVSAGSDIPVPKTRAEKSAEKILALLPGSRRQEIRRIWPPMLEAALQLQKEIPGLKLVVPIAPTLGRENFGHAPGVQFVQNSHAAFAGATAAIVKSGTSTLEAALFGVPLVCVYRTSWLTYAVGRALVKVKYIALPNLLAQRPLIPELIQSECTPQKIAQSVRPLLEEASPQRQAQLQGLARIREELGVKNAARAAAEEVAALL